MRRLASFFQAAARLKAQNVPVTLNAGLIDLAADVIPAPTRQLAQPVRQVTQVLLTKGGWHV